MGGPETAKARGRLSARCDHTWGTELLLDVAGLVDGGTYQVVYRTTGGETTGAGSFRSVANTLMECRFNAAPLRSDLVAIAVLDGAGDEVMAAQLA